MSFLAGMVIVSLFFALVAQAIGAVLGAAASSASTEKVLGYGVALRIPLGAVRLIANIVRVDSARRGVHDDPLVVGTRIQFTY